MFKETNFNNVWFIRFVSLLISIFLYIFVASEKSVPLRAIQNQEFASVNVTETISNVPVYLGKTDGETFVSGVPDTVDVRLTGPKSIINQVSNETLRVETEDLTKMQTGSKSIRYLVMNLPDEVDYQVTPSRTIVQISRRESIKLPIEYEVDPEAIDPNFQVKQVDLKTKEVTLTGTDKIIKAIDRVYINITSEESQNQDFSGVYGIKIVDKEGNLLDVNANVVDIEVDVSLVPSTQEVSLNLLVQGENTENFTYTYEFADQDYVLINYNPNVHSINAILDVSGLTSDASLMAQLEIPDSVELVGQAEISVNVYLQPIRIIENSFVETSQEDIVTSEADSNETDSNDDTEE